MKTKQLIAFLLIAFVGGFLCSCEEEKEESTVVISAAFLDETQWQNDLLLPYSDATYGYDFSAKEHNNTSRDCYLDMTTSSIVNSFLFSGKNHIKRFTATEFEALTTLPIPTSWDATNEPLSADYYYLLECADGFVIIKPVGSHFDEWVMNFSFVSTADLTTYYTKTKS